MRDMLVEFPNFKKPKRLEELIIELNRLEEMGDEMYISNMRRLHTTSDNALEVTAWREIYTFFGGNAADACEDVAGNCGNHCDCKHLIACALLAFVNACNTRKAAQNGLEAT